MKKKTDYRWVMGWQSPSKKNIEEILKEAVEHFLKKYFVLPELIYVNPSVDLKVYGNILLKSDIQCYTRGILFLQIPKEQEEKL